jgi:SNF2 family DNA or RNA helicase
MKTVSRKLLPYQVWAVNQLEYKPGLFLPCGTGKTLTAIRYVVKHHLLPALVICRRDDMLTWTTELGNENFRDGVLAIRKFRELPLEIPSWTLITYDRVKKLRGPISNANFKVVLVDESYMIKRWKAARTKSVVGATKTIPCRIAMTATPSTNDVGDVFTQALFMDRGRTFGTSYWDFRNRYYLQLPHGGWCLKHGAKEEILNKFKHLAITIDAGDVLDLPPVRRLIKSTPISGAQKRIQRSILEEWEYQLKDRPVVELNYVISQIAKLRQVASGFIYGDSGNAYWMKCHKLSLLKELVVNPDLLGNKPKLVIWCAFTAEIDRIVDMFSGLGILSVAFYGKKNKDAARLEFKKSDQVQLFVGQADSGIGMNELVVADTAIYFSNSYRVLSRKQSEGRLLRKGSERHKSITYYDLVTEDTIDVQVLKKLQEGVSLADFVLRRLREGLRPTQIFRSQSC